MLNFLFRCANEVTYTPGELSCRKDEDDSLQCALGYMEGESEAEKQKKGWREERRLPEGEDKFI